MTIALRHPFMEITEVVTTTVAATTTGVPPGRRASSSDEEEKTSLEDMEVDNDTFDHELLQQENQNTLAKLNTNRFSLSSLTIKNDLKPTLPDTIVNESGFEATFQQEDFSIPIQNDVSKSYSKLESDLLSAVERSDQEALQKINKHKILTQMVLYLLYSHDESELKSKFNGNLPDFGVITQYGCWCSPNVDFEWFKKNGKKPVAIDEIDRSCRARASCSRCASSDLSCDMSSGYKISGHLSTETRSLDCSANPENSCQRQMCECDKHFAEKVYNGIWTWSSGNSALSYSETIPSFNWRKSCWAKKEEDEVTPIVLSPMEKAVEVFELDLELVNEDQELQVEPKEVELTQNLIKREQAYGNIVLDYEEEEQDEGNDIVDTESSTNLGGPIKKAVEHQLNHIYEDIFRHVDFEEQCCGTFPNRFIYYSRDNDKECCRGKVFESSGQECCENGEVALFGACL